MASTRAIIAILRVDAIAAAVALSVAVAGLEGLVSCEPVGVVGLEEVSSVASAVGLLLLSLVLSLDDVVGVVGVLVSP